MFVVNENGIHIKYDWLALLSIFVVKYVSCNPKSVVVQVHVFVLSSHCPLICGVTVKSLKTNVSGAGAVNLNPLGNLI